MVKVHTNKNFNRRRVYSFVFTLYIGKRCFLPLTVHTDRKMPFVMVGFWVAYDRISVYLVLLLLTYRVFSVYGLVWNSNVCCMYIMLNCLTSHRALVCVFVYTLNARWHTCWQLVSFRSCHNCASIHSGQWHCAPRHDKS